MLVKFETRMDKDTYKDVWINPKYVVSVVAAYARLYEGHTTITTVARVDENENECWIIKGKPAEIVNRLEPPPRRRADGGPLEQPS